MHSLAPQASLRAGQLPALAFAGSGLDGSNGLWRKEASGAGGIGSETAAQVTPASLKPDVRFTALLEDLVGPAASGASGAGGKSAAVPKKDASATGKEDGTLAAYWMAAPATFPQARQAIQKDGDGSAARDEAGQSEGQTSGAGSQEPSEAAVLAATTVLKGASGPAVLPVVATPTQTVCESGVELPQTATPAAGSEPKLAQTPQPLPEHTNTTGEEEKGGSISDRSRADEELEVRPEQMAQPAARAVTDRQPAATSPAEAISPAVETMAWSTAQTGQNTKLRAMESSRSATKARAADAQARTGEMDHRPEAPSQPEAMAGNSTDLTSAALTAMVQTQLPTVGPAIDQSAARVAAGPDRSLRPAPAARSTARRSSGTDVTGGARIDGTQSLTAPVATVQTPVASLTDASEDQARTDVETAPTDFARPATDSVTAELAGGGSGDRTAQPTVVAFTARLHPVEIATSSSQSGLGNQAVDPAEAAAVSNAPQPAGAAAQIERENSRSSGRASARQQDGSREPARKQEAAAAAVGATDSAMTARPSAQPQATAGNDAKPRDSVSSLSQPAAATEPAAAAEAPKATVRDIKLEVAGQGDQRVEVRISERAGDMHVAVRTPDSGLAGDLRNDLPSLASRLEQSGFRAETWHPSGTAERQQAAEAPASADSQNSQRQPGQDGGQRQRDQQQQPKPKASEDGGTSQKQGTDFAWLFSSIQ